MKKDFDFGPRYTSGHLVNRGIITHNFPNISLFKPLETTDQNSLSKVIAIRYEIDRRLTYIEKNNLKIGDLVATCNRAGIIEKITSLGELILIGMPDPTRPKCFRKIKLDIAEHHELLDKALIAMDRNGKKRSIYIVEEYLQRYRNSHNS